MLPFLQFLIALTILISAAKAGGYLTYRAGQPSVLGELLAGILLGPIALNFLDWPIFTDLHLKENISHLGELGVLLLMFIAGLELHLSDLVRSGRVAAAAGILGVVVPLALGSALGLAFAADFGSALFIGLILAATSVSISAQTLMELGVLHSRVGIGMLGAAVLDDILVILGISIALAVSHGSGVPDFANILEIVLRMLLYLITATLAGLWLLPRLSRWVQGLPISQGLIAFTFVSLLLYAWSAEVLGGMAAITGAFVAGLVLARSEVKESIRNGMSALAYGIFVPIFFVNVGLSADARAWTADNLWLFLVMTAVAVLGKVLGAGLGARLTGFNNREALQLGVGMMSRGEVGLIAVTLGVNEGVIAPDFFTPVVGVVIVTTLLAPPLLRALFSGTRPEPLVKERAYGD